jgi:hypothetical protein
MPYEYQEFPCWVSHTDGQQKIVHSEDEFAALDDGWKKPPEYVSPGFGPGRVVQEYPKWVGDTLVHNAQEEANLVRIEDAGMPADSIEREALIQIAAEKGVKIDKRWSDDKIRAAVVAA